MGRGLCGVVRGGPPNLSFKYQQTLSWFSNAYLSAKLAHRAPTGFKRESWHLEDWPDSEH